MPIIFQGAGALLAVVLSVVTLVKTMQSGYTAINNKLLDENTRLTQKDAEQQALLDIAKGERNNLDRKIDEMQTKISECEKRHAVCEERTTFLGIQIDRLQSEISLLRTELNDLRTQKSAAQSNTPLA
jgi:phage shock protein A